MSYDIVHILCPMCVYFCVFDDRDINQLPVENIYQYSIHIPCAGMGPRITQITYISVDWNSLSHVSMHCTRDY